MHQYNVHVQVENYKELSNTTKLVVDLAFEDGQLIFSGQEITVKGLFDLLAKESPKGATDTKA